METRLNIKKDQQNPLRQIMGLLEAALTLLQQQEESPENKYSPPTDRTVNQSSKTAGVAKKSWVCAECRGTYTSDDLDKHYGPRCPHRYTHAAGLPNDFFEPTPPRLYK
jgi:hypothetical protein